MATEPGNTSAKRAKLTVPEPLNSTEKEQHQKSPMNCGLMNGNLTACIGNNIGRKSRSHSPKHGSNNLKLSPHSPTSNSHSPKGSTLSPKGGVVSPKDSVVSPKGGVVSPKGSVVSPKGSVVSPKGSVVSPKGSVVSPKSSVGSPKDSVASPKGSVASPKGSVVSSKGSVVSLLGSVVGPKGSVVSPMGSVVSPKCSVVSLKGSVFSPKSGVNSSKGSVVSPTDNVVSPKGNFVTVCSKASVVSPKCRVNNSKGIITSPKCGGISPKGSVKSSKSGPQSPRNSQQSSKGGQHIPCNRPRSPRGRPHCNKGSPGRQKNNKSVDNSHGGIYNTLHVDVDLANNKLTVPPLDGRRCHSDSRISVKKSNRNIAPSESKKRKLDFTDVKTKRTSPSGKKRKTDSFEIVSNTLTLTKQGDRTVDHNQNIQVAKVECGRRRNSWDNSLHSPDQYKSIHSIGSRKAVLKVATYSDIILTSTRRSLPACTATCVNVNGLTNKSEVQVEALDLSMASVKDHSSLIKKQLNDSTLPNTPSVMVSCQPEIVVSGESETSSIESDPTDKYEKVDTDILFKKDAIAKNVAIDTDNRCMEQEINSTADKEHSTPSDDMFESHKEKRSLTPESEEDDSAFSTDDTPSIEGEQKNISNGKKPKRVAKKYADLLPRAPRKRRMASLTAETKNLLLFEKDITAPAPAVKKSPVGDKGHKQKREDLEESQPLLPLGVSDGSLLQTINDFVPQGTTVTDLKGIPTTDHTGVNVCRQCGNKKNIALPENTESDVIRDCNITVDTHTQKVPADSAGFTCLVKDKQTERTQTEHLKLPVHSVPNNIGTSVLFTTTTTKDTQRDYTPNKIPVKTSPAVAFTSSPSKSSHLLPSRCEAALDSAECQKLTAITMTTSITSPLLLRMSRHSMDGANSGDEALIPSPTGFDPRSISLLQPGGILTGNFNGQSASSSHYIPKSRVLKKIIKPANLKPYKACRRHSTNGWKAVGEPVPKPIILLNETIREVRLCYESIKRKEDVIQVRDCVLLRSGVKRKDLPFVAKVSALWEDPESGEIMMSLLWYYRPEHTEAGRRPYHIQNELFACRHWDINSVACIEDKCYVLTPAEYNRYRKILQRKKENYPQCIPVVPESPVGYPRQPRIPRNKTHPDSVFLCRQVYDFRQKRILKNPY